jgi:hypothetical protein
MRKSIPLQLAIALGISVLAGCSSNKSVNDTAMDARIAQAVNHGSLSERNAELQRIALDATDAGEIDQAVRATQSISLEPLRDDTARAAARRFEKQGQKEHAARMASLIADPAMRAQLNAELAGQK